MLATTMITKTAVMTMTMMMMVMTTTTMKGMDIVIVITFEGEKMFFYVKGDIVIDEKDGDTEEVVRVRWADYNWSAGADGWVER